MKQINQTKMLALLTECDTIPDF